MHIKSKVEVSSNSHIKKLRKPNTATRLEIAAVYSGGTVGVTTPTWCGGDGGGWVVADTVHNPRQLKFFNTPLLEKGQV